MPRALKLIEILKRKGLKIMKQLEMHIKELLIGNPPIKIITEEGMEEFGEIVDIHREISYGQIELSEEGKLTSLMIDLEEITNNNDVSLDEYESLSKEDLIEMGQDFVDDFGMPNLKLNSFTEWGEDTFMLVFEAMDVKLQLPLPESGVTLEMNRQGFILSATLNQSYYQLKYPDIIVTAEDALAIYSNRQMVELVATYDEEAIQLMYYPKYLNEAITTDGKIIPLIDFTDEQQLAIREITEVPTSYTEEELLGITADLIKIEEEGVKLYVSKEFEDRMLKVDTSDEDSLVIESNLPFIEAEEIPAEELRKRAIAFLELKVGDISSKYLLEDLPDADFGMDDEEEEEEEELTEEEIAFLTELSAAEEEFEEDEDEDEEEDEYEDDFNFEPFITFSFRRQFQGMELRDFDTNIDVGIYSGTVKDATIPLLHLDESEPVNLTPEIPLEEAEQVYRASIKMELARVPHEEEDFTLYELCYVVKEHEERIECIDAHNGNVFYFDNAEYSEED